MINCFLMLSLIDNAFFALQLFYDCLLDEATAIWCCLQMLSRVTAEKIYLFVLLVYQLVGVRARR